MIIKARSLWAHWGMLAFFKDYKEKNKKKKRAERGVGRNQNQRLYFKGAEEEERSVGGDSC